MGSPDFKFGFDYRFPSAVSQGIGKSTLDTAHPLTSTKRTRVVISTKNS